MSVVLITGVNGFIGSRLAADLARRGNRIVGSTSHESGLHTVTPGVSDKVLLPLGGPCDPDIFRGIDVVVHCAWDLRPGTMQANIDGTKRLVEVADQAGVSYQVFVSSYSAHAAAVSDYGRAKLAVQEYCLGRGLAAARPGLVIGAGGLFQRMSDTVARHPVVALVNSGRAKVPIVAVHDLVCALGSIVERRLTGLYTLFNPDKTTLRDLMVEIRAAARRRTLLLPVPSRLLLIPLWLMVKIGITLPFSVDSLRALEANASVQDASDLPMFVGRPISLAEMVRAANLPRRHAS